MSYSLIATPEFEKQLRILSRKYRNLKGDLNESFGVLKDNPVAGESIRGLENRVYKLRVSSSDMQRGKSGGFRVIYYLVGKDRKIFLLTLYAKARRETINTREIKKLLTQLDL